MNREEIIRMAREAGFIPEVTYEMAEELERFAKLITVHLLPSMSWPDGYEAGVVAEREACAKLCEYANKEYEPFTGQLRALNYTCADLIRARGKE